MMMGVTAPGVRLGQGSLRAVVQVQSSDQLGYLPVLLLLFGQRGAVLPAEAQRGQAAVAPAAMLRSDAVRKRPLVQVAFSSIDPGAETGFVLRTVGSPVHLGRCQVRVRRGQSPGRTQSRVVTVWVLSSASVSCRSVCSSRVDGRSRRWRHHWKRSVDRDDRCGCRDRSETPWMMVRLPG